MTALPPDLDFAVRTARTAGALAMRWFQSAELVADGKADGSPVTQADREAERLVRDEIQRAFPDDGVIGEEFSEKPSRNGRVWVVDPIDGTRSFVQGVPLFGTMLALLVDGLPDTGVVYMPGLDECVGARLGAGCWWWPSGSAEPRRAEVTDHAEIRGCVALSTSLEYYRNERHKRAWSRLNDLGAVTRGWSDCYAFVLLATGRADVVIEPDVKLWDLAAPAVVVREAGGAWSNIEGGADVRAGSVVATNGRLHDAVMGLIRDA